MLLEVRGWSTRTLHERVLPLLERWGFRARPELAWSDPGTDGEYGAVYLEYAAEDPLPSADLCQALGEAQALLGEDATIALVARPGR